MVIKIMIVFIDDVSGNDANEVGDDDNVDDHVSDDGDVDNDNYDYETIRAQFKPYV